MGNQQKKIIIVDDNVVNLNRSRDILNPLYKVYPVPSAVDFFVILEKITPDLVLMDIEMPKMNGYEAVKIMKADSRFAGIPVIFLTAYDDDESELKGFDLGAVDYITKPFSVPRLLKRIENQLLIQDYAHNLQGMVERKTQEVVHLQDAILATVADLVEFRDKNTGGHISRTQSYLKALADELLRLNIYADEIRKWDMKLFLHSAQLHDVGKIAISDMILSKPDKLTPEEFEIMKTHVAAGVDAIRHMMSAAEENTFLNHALLIAGNHHERWDGSGYPAGLKGSNIPLEGRLMAIADVYDALISERPYKNAFSHEDACRIIEDGSGTHFDPVLVEAFQNVKDRFNPLR